MCYVESAKVVHAGTSGGSTDNAPDADFHGLVGNMVRQKTMMANREKTQLNADVPTYEVKDATQC